MNSYLCAGDRGDCIAGLPVVKHTGGGIYYIQAVNYTRERLTPENWCGLDRILKAQPYITDVREWCGERVTFNLNDWRARLDMALRQNRDRDRAISTWQIEQFGLPLTITDEPWVTIPLRKVARVVFNRTGVGRHPRHVYHNPRFPWHLVWRLYQKDAVFVGTTEEHAVFCATCGEVPHEKTADLYEAAQVIAGCDLFVGNQSACFWLAESMKKRILLEVWPSGANCLLPREGVVHGWDERVLLPIL